MKRKWCRGNKNVEVSTSKPKQKNVHQPPFYKDMKCIQHTDYQLLLQIHQKVIMMISKKKNGRKQSIENW